MVVQGQMRDACVSRMKRMARMVFTPIGGVHPSTHLRTHTHTHTRRASVARELALRHNPSRRRHTGDRSARGCGAHSTSSECHTTVVGTNVRWRSRIWRALLRPEARPGKAECYVKCVTTYDAAIHHTPSVTVRRRRGVCDSALLFATPVIARARRERHGMGTAYSGTVRAAGTPTLRGYGWHHLMTVPAGRRLRRRLAARRRPAAATAARRRPPPLPPSLTRMRRG